MLALNNARCGNLIYHKCFSKCSISFSLKFAGGMVASALLGEPVLGPLKNTPQLLVATACW